MLDASARDLVRGTAPVLLQHGEALTRHFYDRMLSHNPELREVFNQSHQRAGAQQQALAAAVAAYATHIDNPAVLMPVLERVAARHVSLNVRPEQYAIVGRHLLASMTEVLGAAATPELIAAWRAAYGQLATLLIGMEQARYDASAVADGGWSGWRSFRVEQRIIESIAATSFVLRPADGGSLPHWQAGQYLTLRTLVPQLGYRQPRHYTISTAPGRNLLRITVQREARPDEIPGMVSNHLHDHLQEGDILEIAPPQGEFFLDEDRTTPVLLLSGGIGITPMMAMLERLHDTASPRSIHFLHAARSASLQVFGTPVRTLIAGLPAARAWIVHGHADAGNRGAAIRDATGRLDLPHLMAQEILRITADTDAYVCGPRGFMQAQVSALQALGLPAARIHVEAFGTGGPQL